MGNTRAMYKPQIGDCTLPVHGDVPEDAAVATTYSPP